MADIKNITIDGTTYDLKDDKARNDITDLKEDINLIEEKVESINLFKGDLWDVDGYISNNALVEASGYKTTKPIYLESGSYMFVGYKTTYGANYLNCWKCNQSGTSLSQVSGTDTDEKIYNGNVLAVTISESGYYRFNAGTGASTLYFLVMKGDDPEDFPESYTPYFEPFGKIKEEAIDNSSLIVSETKQGENLFEGFAPIDGYFGGNRTVITASGYKISNPIYLEVGTYFYNLQNGGYGASALNFSETIGKLTGNGDIIASLTSENTGETITIASYTYNINKATILHSGWYSFHAGVGSSSNSFMIIKGDNVSDFPTAYITPYKIKTVEENIHLSDTMKSDVIALGAYNPLYGKFLSVNGDSICQGAGYAGGYAKIIGENNAMTVQNIGVGGGTITAETYSDGSTARHWICRTISNMNFDADYAILEGGVNDASLGIPLGAITANYISELDDTTYYGAMESCCKQLTTRFAGKKYGFILPHQMTTNYRVTNDEATSYYWAVIKCCEKWGVPYLDLNKEVPPFAMFPSTATDLYALTQAYTHNGDGWHPNEAGYRKYYVPKIIAWMKTL